jgi:hypothetical protein
MALKIKKNLRSVVQSDSKGPRNHMDEMIESQNGIIVDVLLNQKNVKLRDRLYYFNGVSWCFCALVAGFIYQVR